MQISFLGLLFIVFFILKVAGLLTWSWLWITAPLWGGLALVIALVVFLLVVDVIKDVLK